MFADNVCRPKNHPYGEDDNSSGAERMFDIMATQLGQVV